MLDNLCIKPNDKISTYNMDFMHYTSQLDWENSVLYHCYYQRLSNQIQNLISIWKQEKPTLFQNMYTLAITINYCYWKCNCKYHHTRQIEKEALESYSQKQDKAFSTDNAIVSQNKANTFLVASSTKSFSFKPSPPLLSRNNQIFYR